jgi:hypothetical protein
MTAKNSQELALAALGIVAIIGGILPMPSLLGIGLIVIGAIFIAGLLVLGSRCRSIETGAAVPRDR